MMASLLRIAAGQAVGVYDDRLRPIYEALGRMVVTRASEVEFDHASGDWIAICQGQVIARGKSRAAVIAAEVRYLEAQIESHN